MRPVEIVGDVPAEELPPQWERDSSRRPRTRLARPAPARARWQAGPASRPWPRHQAVLVATHRPSSPHLCPPTCSLYLARDARLFPALPLQPVTKRRCLHQRPELYERHPRLDRYLEREFRPLVRVKTADQVVASPAPYCDRPSFSGIQATVEYTAIESAWTLLTTHPGGTRPSVSAWRIQRIGLASPGCLEIRLSTGAATPRLSGSPGSEGTGLRSWGGSSHSRPDRRSGTPVG